MAFAARAGKRQSAAAFAEIDRLVTATSWGVAIAFDPKHRASRKWATIRQKSIPNQRGLTGDSLERAVMNIAVMFPGQVTREVAA